jgi:hypothetical protein
MPGGVAAVKEAAAAAAAVEADAAVVAPAVAVERRQVVLGVLTRAGAPAAPPLVF